MSKPKLHVVQQLKNWYIIDSILFNDDPKKIIKDDEILKEYSLCKMAFCSNLFEFYQEVGIKPQKIQYKNSKLLQESAIEQAKKSSAISTVILAKESIKKTMTNCLINESKKFKNSKVDAITDIIVEANQKLYSMNNAFIGLPLLENDMTEIPSKKNFKCEIMYEAYKIQRDTLINIAMKCKRFSIKK